VRTYGSRGSGTLHEDLSISETRRERRREHTKMSREVGHSCLSFDEAKHKGFYMHFETKETNTSSLEYGKKGVTAKGKWG
jgi:hypothetical protein